MTRVRRVALSGAFLLLAASTARADITAFLGANTTPANRPTLGAAIGAGFVVVAFEFEYASTASDVTVAAPELKTGMGNVLLQTPGAIYGFQPYFTTGAGIYHEVLGPHTDTGVGFNTGGGAKISLIGPLKLRVDYRVIKLGSGALYSPAHRIYAGMNLSF
jgi:hypothetical protein